MRKLFRLLLLLSIFFITSENIFAQVTDIDGNTYKTVKIGDQVWMAENLRVTRFNDGSEIIFASDDSKWRGYDGKAKYTYPNFDKSLESGGFVYNSEVVYGDNNIAPEGWRVPTEEDWLNLRKFLESKYDPENISVECEKEWESKQENCFMAQQLRSTEIWKGEDGSWNKRGKDGFGFNAKQMIVYHSGNSGGKTGFDGWSKYAGITGWYSSTIEVVEHPGSDVMAAGTYEYKKNVKLGIESNIKFNESDDYVTGMYIRLIKE